MLLFLPFLHLKPFLSQSLSPFVSSHLKSSLQPSHHPRHLSWSYIASDPCFIVCWVVSPFGCATQFCLLLGCHLISPCCLLASLHLLVSSLVVLVFPLSCCIALSHSLFLTTTLSFSSSPLCFPKSSPIFPLSSSIFPLPIWSGVRVRQLQLPFLQYHILKKLGNLNPLLAQVRGPLFGGPPILRSTVSSGIISLAA